jgi:type IV pilus assembly protein PilM
MKITTLWRARAPIQIGIDIQADSVQAVALQLHKTGQSSLLHSVQIAIPPGAMQGHRWLDGKAIQTAIEKLALPKGRVIVAMPQSLVMQKWLKLENSLNKFEIENHLRLEALSYFGYPAEQLCIDFIVAARLEKSQQHIQVIAARTTEVMQRVEILQAAGLNVQAVDIEAQALMRVAALHFSLSNNIVIYCQSETLLMLIIQQQQLFETREIACHALAAPAEKAQAISHQLQLLSITSASFSPENIILINAKPEFADLLSAHCSMPVNTSLLLNEPTVLAQGLALWQ